MAYNQADFDIGDVLAKVFKLSVSQLLPCLAIALIIWIPAGTFIIVLQTASRRIARSEGEATILEVLIFLVISILLFPVMSGAMTYCIFERMNSRSFSLVRSLIAGFSRWASLLSVLFLVYLCAYGAAFLCYFPWFIIWCIFYVSDTVAVIEKRGPIASMERSNDLTYGYKWSIFAVMFILLIIKLTALYLPQIVLALLGPGNEMIAVLSFLTIIIFMIVYLMLDKVASVVVYYELIRIKENTNLEQIASVFD